jgi:hypothetical protein
MKKDARSKRKRVKRMKAWAKKNRVGFFKKQLLFVDHQASFSDEMFLPMNITTDDVQRVRKMLDECGACPIIKGEQPGTEYFSVLDPGISASRVAYNEALLSIWRRNDLLVFNGATNAGDLSLDELKRQAFGTVAHELFMPIKFD